MKNFELYTEHIFKFRFLNNSIYGINAINEVGYEISKQMVKKALIVADSYLVEKTKVVERVKHNIEEYNIEVDVWTDIEPEPSDVSILKGINFAKDKKIDGLIAIGGGSTIDTAKLINLYITYPTTDLYDYFPPPHGKGTKIPAPLKPLIAIPTTSGTGSEVSPAAVITSSKTKEKLVVISEFLKPNVAILDPLLTVTMSPTLTANTGMDALMHAIEAYTIKPFYTREAPKSPEERPILQGSSVITDIFAEKAIRLISKYLIRAYSNGLDLIARKGMHLAAHMAGVAFSNTGVHLAHAIGYSLVEELLKRGKKVPHGVSVAIASPAILKHITPYKFKKCKQLVKLLGEESKGLTIEEVGEVLFKKLTQFLRILNFPNGISGLGFENKEIVSLTENVLKQKRLLINAPFIVTKDDIKKILEESFQYW